MGDILTMTGPFGSPSPANLLDIAPATIHCTGYVFVVDDTSDSFVVTTWQIIHGSIPLNPLTIRGVMSASESQDMPYQTLPPLHSVFSFQGNLLTVEKGITYVAVRAHSYLTMEDNVTDDVQIDTVF